MNTILTSYLLIDGLLSSTRFEQDFTYVGKSSDDADAFVVFKSFISDKSVDNRKCYLAYRSKRNKVGSQRTSLSSIEIFDADNNSIIKFHLADANSINVLCNRVVNYLFDNNLLAR